MISEMGFFYRCKSVAGMLLQKWEVYNFGKRCDAEPGKYGCPQRDVQKFDFIRCSNDAEKLEKLVENDPEFRHLAEDAYDVIAQYAKAPELLEQKENLTGKDGKVNMCKALKELIADGEARGEARGEERGEARMGDLCTILMNENRFDDMKRAVSDRAYRNRLFAKYNISGTAE